MASIPDASSSTSERDPLLPERQHTLTHSTRQLSPLTLLIPLAVATRLTATLPSTTLLAVIQAVICRLWLTSNGTLPPDGHISKELCAVPDVQKLYAAVISAISILDGLGAIVACGVISFISSRLGRKPVILCVVSLSILSYSLLVFSNYLPPWLEASTLVASLFMQTITNVLTMTFIVNVYAVDISSAEERTPVLSAINGWAMLGQVVSFAIGGLITTKTNDPLIVFYICIAILGMTFVYVSALLPESFPDEKRNELRRQRLAKQNLDASARHNPLNRLISMIAVAFEPLKQLAPTRRMDGRRNWRVALCAIHIIIAALGETYMPTTLLLLYTTKYDYNPAQTGTLLMTLSLSGMFTLTWVIPRLIRVLRPIYATGVVLPEDQQDSCDETVLNTSTDLLDVHITIMSWVISAVAYIMAAATSTLVLHLIAATMIGFSAAHAPIFRSLVVASVEPLKQGEVLAAMEMMSGIGVFLSPVVMGSIFTATISKLPYILVFYVHAAIVIGAASLLFLIRDSDRYQTPRRAQD